MMLLWWKKIKIGKRKTLLSKIEAVLSIVCKISLWLKSLAAQKGSCSTPLGRTDKYFVSFGYYNPTFFSGLFSLVDTYYQNNNFPLIGWHCLTHTLYFSSHWLNTINHKLVTTEQSAMSIVYLLETQCLSVQTRGK